MIYSLIQDTAQDAANALPDGEQTEKTLSIIELISSGGLAGQIIIAILFVLLVVAIYIYFERIFAIKEASKVDPNFMKLISKGISRIGKPLEDINTAIENAGRLEVYGLEKNVSVLATISGAAPMIGFLGTVVGMILAIFELANAGGTIQMDTLASGLYTAMTTTVAGLIVGIVGYIAYNHLVVRTNKVVYQMEANSLEFLDHLNEPV